VVVRQAALVSDKTKRVRGVYARRAIQIDDLYLFTFTFKHIIRYMVELMFLVVIGPCHGTVMY